MRNKIFSNYLGAFVAGAFLPLAFAPLEWWWLSFLCLSLWFYTLYKSSTSKESTICGLLFGLGQFGVGTSWVYISIYSFGNASWWLAALITTTFITILALFPAIQAYCLRRFFNDSFTVFLMALPPSMVLMEWGRSYLFTGFPWLLIGHSQTTGPLHVLAPWIGSSGLTFVVSAIAVSFIALYFYFRNRVLSSPCVIASETIPHDSKPFAKYLFPHVGITIIFITFILIFIFTIEILTRTHQPRLPSSSFSAQNSKSTLNVALIQGNIAQDLKWSESYLIETIRLYENLSTPWWGQDLVIWPEAAIPATQKALKPVLDELDQVAKTNKTLFLVGIPLEENNHYYNGILALGQGKGEYKKQHLVPFGEYIPFSQFKIIKNFLSFLNLPLGDMVASENKQALLQSSNQKIKIAPYICYEIAYNDIVRASAPSSNLLVTISNDAWFGHSWAAAQHRQIAQMQSLQTRRTQLLVANTGITAIISSDGKIIQALAPFTRGVLSGQAELIEGITLWVWMGDWPLRLLCLLIVGSLGLKNYRNTQYLNQKTAEA